MVDANVDVPPIYESQDQEAAELSDKMAKALIFNPIMPTNKQKYLKTELLHVEQLMQAGAAHCPLLRYVFKGDKHYHHYKCPLITRLADATIMTKSEALGKGYMPYVMCQQF